MDASKIFPKKYGENTNRSNILKMTSPALEHANIMHLTKHIFKCKHPLVVYNHAYCK